MTRMIRHSAAVAALAILLSLLMHFLGLGLTFRPLAEETPGQTTEEVVELGNTFEDVAETAQDPVVPEPAPPPELEAEQPLEPEQAETPPEPEEPQQPEEPTSQALVASANPQRTFAPDTGIVETGRRATIGETGTDDPGAPDPDVLQATDGEPGEAAQASTTPPVETGAAVDPPEGNPEANEDDTAEDVTEPVEPVQEDSSEETPEEDAPVRLAALPDPAPTVPSVTAAPSPATIPVIPLDTEALDPETAETLLEPAPETGEETELAAAAVTASLRPRLRQPRTPSEPQGVRATPQTLRELLRDPSQVIESPLTAYRRSGVDPFQRGGGGNRGGNGFTAGGGPGNSDVTNYAGRVLVHLNRTRKIAVNSRGWARVFFRINPDGSLASVDVIDGNGDAELDRAAKAQVRVAAPFPRPPDGNTRTLVFVYRSR